MKRQLDLLRQDEAERQHDDLLRAQLESEAREEEHAKKKKRKENSFQEKWRSHLSKWDELGLVSLYRHALALPQPTPPGVLHLRFSAKY